MLIYGYKDEFELNPQQLMAASEWFYSRLEEITSSPIENISFSKDNLTIGYTWDDYCRGCHMGTIYESYTIHNDVFFSEQSLGKWIQEEDEKRAKKKERERKLKEAEDRKHQRELERKQYERLKAKFEKGDQK